MLSSLMTAKTTMAAAVSAGALLAGSVGAAAAGVLPAAAQDSASTILAKVGVSVPDSHGDTAGQTGQQSSGQNGTDATKPANGANAHGKAVSSLAKSDTLSGRDKGIAVSKLASGGKSHAGEHGGSTSTDKGQQNGGSQTGGSQAATHQPSQPAGGSGAPTDKVRHPGTDSTTTHDTTGTQTSGDAAGARSAGGSGSAR